MRPKPMGASVLQWCHLRQQMGWGLLGHGVIPFCDYTEAL